MDVFNETYKNGLEFYYKVGNTSTNKPWKKPTYDSVYKLLTDIQILNVLSNYKTYLIGTCLWDFNTTDVDLYLVPLYNINYDDMEKHIDTINDLSLNKYRLLTDVSISYKNHKLPNKKDIQDENTVFENNNTVIKIGYIEKQIGDNKRIIDFDEIKKDKINVVKLNNNFLIQYNTLYHNQKIIKRIFNSKKDKLINELLLSDFLTMSKDEFMKIQNY